MTETIRIEYNESRRYDIWTEHEEAMIHLDQHGYVVISNVASLEGIDMAKNNFFDHYESVFPNLNRFDATTWKDGDWPASIENGICSSYRFNHSAFCWNSRLLPAVKESFNRIWSSDDLIVSYDGGNVFRPFHQNPLWRTTDATWWHVDQNSKIPGHRGKVCVQGLVTYTDVTPFSGGFCCIQGSHHHHDTLCDRQTNDSMDFIQVDPSDELLRVGPAYLVGAKAGDLILWDSRTIHCNSCALHPCADSSSRDRDVSATQQVDNELLRLAAYVCMVPFSSATPQVIEMRKKAFISETPTSHWPNKKIGCFVSKAPRDPSLCSREMRLLIGYRDP